MQRHLIRCFAILIMTGLVCGMIAHVAEASEVLTVADIRAGLRVSAAEDGGFIAYVVRKVDRGELPRAILHKAFLWARTQPKNKFQYFKRGIRVLAARQQIRL